VFLATQFDATVASIGGKAIGWKNLENLKSLIKTNFLNTFLVNGKSEIGKEIYDQNFNNLL
jgi:hypothetical protein